MEPQQKAARKIEQYQPPAFENWSYWRTAEPPYRVFHVVDIAHGANWQYEKVAWQEWGKPKPEFVPYDKFCQAIEDKRMIPFNPIADQYLFNNKANGTAPQHKHTA